MHSLYGSFLDNPTSSVNGRIPRCVRGVTVPSEMIVVHEMTVRMYLVLEVIMHDLVSECSVREIRTNNKRATGNVGKS